MVQKLFIIKLDRVIVSLLKKGFLKQNLEYTHVITIDADGELSPMYIKKYLNFLKTSNNFGIRKKKARFARIFDWLLL